MDDADEATVLRLRARLLEGVPRRVALLGERAAALIDLPAEGEGRDDAMPQSTPRWLRFPSLADCLRAAPAARRADVALLALVAEAPGADAADDPFAASRPAASAAERLLGAACRLYPARLLLHVESDALPAARAFAFGFRRLDALGEARLYEYSLSDYKAPPEWLNARFWAHPERFGLDPDESRGSGEDDEDDAEDEAEVLREP